MILKNQFKKVYANFAIFLQKAEADFGAKPECYYVGNNSYKLRDCWYVSEAFVKNTDIIKKCERNAFAGGCIPDYKGLDDLVREANPDKTDDELNFGFCTEWNRTLMKSQYAYILKDGTIILRSNNGVHYLLDINGFKGPNKWGYDLFALDLYSPSQKAPWALSTPTSCSSKKDKGGVLPSQMIQESLLK